MRTIDLFSGCGGMSLGFLNAGFNILSAVEYWSPARKVYAHNFSHPVYEFDLNNTEEAVCRLKKYQPEVIIGGPPCQEFSMAGVRVEGSRAQLTYNFAEIVCSLAPKWFVFENVPGAQKSNTWEKSKKSLEKAGYGITEVVLNAAFYNVPQNRKRFFAIGRLGEQKDFLLEDLQKTASEKKMTLRDYAGKKISIEFYYRHPRNWGRKGIFSIDEPAPTVRATVRNVPPGYKSHPDDAGPISEARALNIRERALVQTFPDDFVFCGTQTDQNTMIANAVPVQLAKHIAQCISVYEMKLEREKFDIFREWLGTNYKYKKTAINNILCRLRKTEKMHSHPDVQKRLDEIKKADHFNSLSKHEKLKIKQALKYRLLFEMNF